MPRRFLARIALLVWATFAHGAEPPKIEALRTNTGYPSIFHVRFKVPDDLILPLSGNDPADRARLPRLVSDKTQAVHVRYIAYSQFKQGSLEFVGLWPKRNDPSDFELEFRLIYPVAAGKDAKKGKDASERLTWVDVPVVLKWADAKTVEQRSNHDSRKRPSNTTISRACGPRQCRAISPRCANMPDFGFYAYVRPPWPGNSNCRRLPD